MIYMHLRYTMSIVHDLCWIITSHKPVDNQKGLTIFRPTEYFESITYNSWL